MTDNLTKKRPQDANKVNINQQYEVNYWCDEFNCSEEELIEAVNAVGPMAADVKAYIVEKRQHRHIHRFKP